VKIKSHDYTTTKIFIALVNHAFSFCESNNTTFDTNGEIVEEDWTKFLHRIAAPVNLAGLYYVNDVMRDFQKFPALFQRLSNVLQFEEYIASSLEYELRLEKIDQKEYRRTRIAHGWCADYPIYTLLFSYNTYEQTSDAKWLLVLFLEHFFKTQNILHDPALQPKSISRAELVCRAFRMLMNRSNRDFSAEMLQINFESATAKDIAEQFELILETFSGVMAGKQYQQTLVRFFNTNWAVPTTRIRTPLGPPSPWKKVTKIWTQPIAGASSDIHSLVLPTDVVISSEGHIQDDQYLTQTIVLADADEESTRHPAALLSEKIAFDKERKKARVLDITQKVRIAQNATLNNINLLSATRIRNLVTIIKKWNLSESKRNESIALFCSFTLGKSISEVYDLKVFFTLTEMDQGLYIDNNNQGWWYFSNTNLTQFKSSISEKLLQASEKWVITPAPHFITDCFVSRRLDGKSASFFQNVTLIELRASLERKLKKYSDWSGDGNISLKSIAHFVSRFIASTNQIDPVIFDFSYHNLTYSCRVSRSYVNLADGQRMTMLGKYWNSVNDYALNTDLAHFFFVPKNHTPLVSTRVGSKFVVNNQGHLQLVEYLKSELEKYKPNPTKSLQSIIEYHNAYARYTTWLLNFAVGYRSVHNPLPTLSMHLEYCKLMVISDKDDSDLTNTRLVAVADVLSSQIQNYKAHLFRVAELLRLFFPFTSTELDAFVIVEKTLQNQAPRDVKKWFKTIKNSREQLGPLFVFSTDMKCKNISPKILSDSLPSILQLPSNTGRHWLKTLLMEESMSPELINWQMGHWDAGQAPLDPQSSFNVVSASQCIGRVIHSNLVKAGWSACKSELL